MTHKTSKQKSIASCALAIEIIFHPSRIEYYSLAAAYNSNGQGVSLIRIDWFLWWLPPGECFERGLNTLLVDYITHYRDYPCCMYLWLAWGWRIFILLKNIFIIFSPNKILLAILPLSLYTFPSIISVMCASAVSILILSAKWISTLHFHRKSSVISLSQAVCGFLLC